VAIHEARTVPASTLIQMVRRVRNPREKEILIGVPKWQRRKSIRTDRPSLDDMIHTRHRRTVAGISVAFPEVSDEHPSIQEHDPDFLLSWRISIRKAAESLKDPIGQLLATCERHGIPVIDDLEMETSAVCEQWEHARSAQTSTPRRYPQLRNSRPRNSTHARGPPRFSLVTAKTSRTSTQDPRRHQRRADIRS